MKNENVSFFCFLCVRDPMEVFDEVLDPNAFFLLNFLNIRFIYNKVINLIRYNKFINKSLIFNNKLTAAIFDILILKITTKKVVPSSPKNDKMVPPWYHFFCNGADPQ